MGRLYEAYIDLKFLLNRGYRKSSALEFVTNHYRLPAEGRYFLARCVFSDSWIIGVYGKLVRTAGDAILGVDGFNVLITLESLLDGVAIRCEDSLVRDIKYQKKYKVNERTWDVLRLMILSIKSAGPREVVIFYGKSVPRSGQVKKATQELLEELSIVGRVELVKSPDFELKKFEYVATADTGIIEKVFHVIDLVDIASTLVGVKPMEFKVALRIFDEKLK
ncbi:hypothetical protein A3L04_03730 [Thermococcus chitonophagus]|uniref:DUF434 domain-containing protein n=1 Tax=Thermococcus chitonophagus TaxID=54262 RepID=A0A161KAU4_9EURY|nr:DUF434 domain-containing protein [Thermococcus chitonophagus]ASJ16249.1 hypothetical protein A3L04_03730 [Thermococcus chitonophagus]CUX78770.1 hypothetical protein CHITON_1991 [Thermococcus chitonophagus]